MSSPHHAAARASVRAHRMALRVSRRWAARSCVRSRSKQRASTAWHKPVAGVSRPNPGPASHVGDDLACVIAQSRSYYLR
jgi:hypothetical protein